MDSLVPASKISDMPTGWICGQTARDFVQTKTGSGGSMNIQESEEFKTSKFYCKTDFDMKEIKRRKPAIYRFPSSTPSNQGMNGNVSFTRTSYRSEKMLRK